MVSVSIACACADDASQSPASGLAARAVEPLVCRKRRRLKSNMKDSSWVGDGNGRDRRRTLTIGLLRRPQYGAAVGLVGHAARVADQLQLQAPRRQEAVDGLPGGRAFGDRQRPGQYPD